MPATSAPPISPIESRGYARPDVLVSTDWVAAHLEDPAVRIVESDEDLLLYETGHVPGAVKIDWVTELNHPVTRDYVGPAEMQALLRSRGIGRDTTVVSWRPSSTHRARPPSMSLSRSSPKSRKTQKA